MNSIAIIGCGWFGLPLATRLVKQGYQVSGTKRTQAGCEHLSSLGIDAYKLDLSEQDIDATQLDGLLEADALIINIPPGLRRGETHYLEHIKTLVNVIAPRQYQRVIFISTTGVYPAENRIMTEADAVANDDKSAILLAAESLIAAMENACIVRFAGLIGPKRHPGKFFAAKTDVSGANVAVNLVHLDDCIQAMEAILAATSSGQNVSSYYNLTAPSHPTRAEFYQAAAADLGLAAPQFNQTQLASKVINGDLICQQLNFNYIHPDPLKMLAAC
ncbi:NAD-dependent epimerase/dehydratase family protein [Shewanella sp. UCD-KL21]|uniref:NAD-dependent epimerase/dehydratase family protein n=1 Tax=Shewanella sp. UCD-KL21 TaxID=1917164 RepID=UPI000970E2D5|nr:NAD-dependent epimerase/dehydratase family protein [Shewanella sp. UCD-KL21]